MFHSFLILTVIIVLSIDDGICGLLSDENMMKRSSIGTMVHGFNMKHRYKHHTVVSNRMYNYWVKGLSTISTNIVSSNQKRCYENNSYNNVRRQQESHWMNVSPTALFYYNNRQQHRWMSKEDKNRNTNKINDDKKNNEQKEPYEWLPFWTTPIRDPHASIYIQDPIAEKDCKPLRLYIPAEDDMLEIGTMVAMLALTTPDLKTYESLPNNGDVIFLKGDLGSGKTVFARGFIRGALGNWNIDVPSPTYLLSNTYFASEDKGSNKNLEYVYSFTYG
jgi:Threonylcarbamoyl adenosine biosynthesis protein TsaE